MTKQITSICFFSLIGAGSLFYHFQSKPKTVLFHAHELVRTAYLAHELNNEVLENSVWQKIEFFLKADENAPLTRYILDDLQSKGINISSLANIP